MYVKMCLITLLFRVSLSVRAWYEIIVIFTSLQLPHTQNIQLENIMASAKIASTFKPPHTHINTAGSLLQG